MNELCDSILETQNNKSNNNRNYCAFLIKEILFFEVLIQKITIKLNFSACKTAAEKATFFSFSSFTVQTGCLKNEDL